MKKRGFTFVEILFTLIIIGVLILITVPTIKKIMPDQNKAKVRKAYNTLTNVVSSMVDDSDIYPDGTFGTGSNGKSVSADYFCKNFADRVNVAGDVNCSSTSSIPDTVSIFTYDDTSSDTANRDSLDRRCTKRTDKSTLAFKTTDGIYWYGMYDDFKKVDTLIVNGIDKRYVVVCIDTDLNGKATDTLYAFAVRRDGKIIASTRTQKILNSKKITEGEITDGE